MTSRTIGTLAGLVLMVAASQAVAQTAPFSMEYRWLTLFGNIEDPVPAVRNDRTWSRGALESVLSRAFVAFESDYRISVPAYTAAEFRQPDPAFGRPAAFQRPRQARLSFRVRF